MDIGKKTRFIEVVLFDFGGVLAEKGFAGGLSAIAKRHKLNESVFYELANELIHKTGYLTGRTDEHAFWQAIRDKTGINDDDNMLRNEILSRFILRPWILDVVKKLRMSDIKTAILSDQTNWLDELNGKGDFFRYFDVVFNSYHIGKSKIDPSHFSDTIKYLDCAPEKLLFIDDNEMHCRTARESGINTICFTDYDTFRKEMERFLPDFGADLFSL